MPLESLLEGLSCERWALCPSVHGLCSHQPVPLQPPAHHAAYLSSGGGSLSSVRPVHTCGWHFPPASAFLCSCTAQRTPLCSCLQTSGHVVESQDDHRTPLWGDSKHLSCVGDGPPSLHMLAVGSQDWEETLVSVGADFLLAHASGTSRQSLPTSSLFLSWKQRLLPT